MKFRIYRFNPEQDRKPYLQDFELEEEQAEISGALPLMPMARRWA